MRHWNPDPRRAWRKPRRSRGSSYGWGEIRLVVLGGVLAGLTIAAIPDSTRQAAASAVGLGGAGDATSVAASAGERSWPRFTRCSGPVRVNCVVDGDTFWAGGEKIRIADLNAPEISSPSCAAEARLGARATDMLIAQLNAGPFTLEPADRDEDRYGRKLRRVTRGGESVGDAMVDAGVARWWGEGRRGWC